MEAVVTIICGTVLALGQAWIQYRLRQQDNARNAAREEAKENAERVRLETKKIAAEAAARVEIAAVKVAKKAENVAAEVVEKVDIAAAQADLQLGAIHVLVNTRLDEALERVRDLELKLGLMAGEDISTGE